MFQDYRSVPVNGQLFFKKSMDTCTIDCRNVSSCMSTFKNITQLHPIAGHTYVYVPCTADTSNSITKYLCYIDTTEAATCSASGRGNASAPPVPSRNFQASKFCSSKFSACLIFVKYSGTCVNGHLRRAVTLHKAVSTESPNGIFHALHTH